MDDNNVVDLAGGAGRGILDNGFGWIRCIRIPCIQPGQWGGREPGDYAGMCVAVRRERAGRQGRMQDVLQFDARAACARAGETQINMRAMTVRAAMIGLAALWSIGASPAAAQPCDGVQVDIGASEQRCLKPGSGQPFKDCRDCPQMVIVPAGSFVMGATPDEEVASPREDQVRGAIATPFAVGRFAVTRGEFAAFVASTGHETDGDCHRIAEPKREAERNWRSPGFAQDDRHPVVCVNWNDARAYAAWISSVTGKNYRLLSEAEREYVTRVGSVTPFWWGSTISTGQANYNGNITHGGGAKGEWRKATVAVDHFSANPWGLYNVHGNVWEWTEDCWNEKNAGNPGDGKPRTTGDCGLRVLRGASFNNFPHTLRSARRERARLGSRVDAFGFRVARSLGVEN
jgi:formylglycine-generating enzyme required for sulfatase activity